MQSARAMPLIILLALAACSPKATPEPAAAATEAPAPAPTAAKAVPLAERIDKAAELLAQEPFDKGRAQQALQLMEQARVEEPGNPLVHFNLGVAHHKLGDLKAAEKAYQSTIGLDPSIGDAFLYVGEIARAEGRNDSAIANFRNGLRSDPENMRLWEALVSALRQAGRTNEAISVARDALKVNARSVEVYNNLGLAYMDQGEYVLARFVFQKAQMGIEGAEDNAYLNTNLGWTYYLEGDVPRALLWLEKARDLDPDLVATRVYLAHIYMDDHNWKDALDALEVAAGRDPENAAIQLNLGICYRGVGRHDDARRAYERALQLDPADPAAMFNLGVLYGDSLKSYDASMQAFQSYIDKGGPEAETAAQHLSDVEKEKTRVEKRKKAEEERKKREQERAERQRLLEQAEKERAERERAALEAERQAQGEESEDEGADPAPEQGPWGESDGNDAAPDGAPQPDGGAQ